MLVMSENLNVRNSRYMESVGSKDWNAIKIMARALAEKGANVIGVQVSTDGIGDEDILPFVAEAAQQGAGLPLCLDSRNTVALKKAVRICSQNPTINYLSKDEKNAIELLSLVRDTDASLIIRALNRTIPLPLESKLAILEDLMEMANAAGIPNERLFADPSLVHISSGLGQEHLLSAHESIVVLKDFVDPPVNTIIWLSNITTGLPKSLKSVVASAYLNYLAGAGLTAALVNVQDETIMRTIYLIKSFRNEVIFTPADIK